MYTTSKSNSTKSQNTNSQQADDSQDSFRELGGVGVLIQYLKEKEGLTKETILCLAKVSNENSKHLHSFILFCLLTFCHCLVESSLVIFYSEVTELVVGVIKKNIEDEELCEGASTVIMRIVTSSDTVGDINASFINSGSFLMFIKLLDKYITNKIICESFIMSTNKLFVTLCHSFTIIKELNGDVSGISATLSMFVEEGGIKDVIKILKEHRHDKRISSSCISVLRILFLDKSKETFHQHRYFFSHML